MFCFIWNGWWYKYRTGIYKSLNIDFWTVMRNSEVLKFVANHLKTKIKHKPAVKKLHFLIKYVPDQDKTQQITDKAVLVNDGTLESNSWLLQKSTDVW